jgi:O-succinylbenzoate synthase
MTGLEYSLQVITRELSLSAPLSFLGENPSVRTACYLVANVNGITVAGEASPLPGWSSDSVQNVLNEAHELQKRLPPLSTASLCFSSEWRAALAQIASPALKVGVEGLILDYLSVTMPELFAPIRSRAVAVNALIAAPNGEELTAQTLQKIQQGFTSIKIKVRPETLDETATHLQALKGKVPNSVSLRLDPNRSLTTNQCEQLIAACEGLPIEYIEDPLNDTARLKEVVASSPVSIALDESAREIPQQEWLSWDGLRHLVIKPSLCGSLLSLDELLARTVARNISITLSSSFESGIGLRAIALSAALFALPAAVGLDTARFFTSDLLEPRFPINTPSINVGALVESRPADVSVQQGATQ